MAGSGEVEGRWCNEFESVLEANIIRATCDGTYVVKESLGIIVDRVKNTACSA